MSTLIAPAENDDDAVAPARQPSVSSGARIYESDAHHTRDTAISIAVLVVASLVDIALAKNAFDVALRLSEAMSWFVAGGVGLIAVAGAFVSGTLAKHRAWPIAVAVLVAPVLVGIALYVLRAGSADTQATVGFEGGSGSLTGAADESILAPVMLLVFVATTILAFADGWRLTDPERSRFRALTHTDDALTGALAEKMGRVARLHEELAIHVAVLSRIDDDREIAIKALESVADELREWARIEVARVLGDPRSTSAIHAPAPRVTTDKRLTA